MTKKIRIENADTSPFKVEVDVIQIGGGDPPRPDSLQQTITLDYPAQMTEVYIHSGQYVIIREKKETL